MQLNSKLYDILKWVTMIVLPACATAYFGLAGIWGWPYADEVVKTIAVITTLLGALLGISTAQYNKSQPIPEDADMKIWPEEESDD
jgi:hypothetical protein